MVSPLLGRVAQQAAVYAPVFQGLARFASIAAIDPSSERQAWLKRVRGGGRGGKMPLAGQRPEETIDGPVTERNRRPDGRCSRRNSRTVRAISSRREGFPPQALGFQDLNP